MDPFSIASIIAMIVGGAVQQQAQSSALKRQKQQAVMAQQRQLDAQNEATQVAARKASEFDPTQRKDRQDQIQQQQQDELTHQADTPQLTAQGVQIGSTLPEGEGSKDFLVAKAREKAKTTASLHALAGLMSRIGSANELRRNEAIGFGDAAGEIGRIQTGSNNMGGIDQIGIGAAGQPSLGAMFAGEALRAGGAYGLGRKPAGRHGSAGGNLQYPEHGMTSGGNGAWL